MSLEIGTRSTGRPPTYPVKVMEFAKRMSAGGHTVSSIQRALNRLGYSPAASTITCWVDPDYAEVRRQRERLGGRAGPPPRQRGWQLRLARAHELRELRTSYRSIAAILNNDFGLELDAEQVRYILQGRYRPESIATLMRGEKLNSGGRPIAEESTK